MALNKTLSFDLELKPGGIPPIIHASQGDIGRMFKANIYWDGSAATSYVSGATVNLRGKKPDKTVFDYTATLAGSMVTFETTEQMTIISGPVECELVFSNDGDVIASANFVLMVEDSPYNPDALSESDIPTIGDLIEDTIGGDVRDEVDALITAHPELMLQDNAVTTPKLANEAVTKVKLSTNLQDTIKQSEGVESCFKYGFVADYTGTPQYDGNDGTRITCTDNTAAFQAMLNDCINKGELKVYFPAGHYGIKEGNIAADLSGCDLTIIGDGMGVSIIDFVKEDTSHESETNPCVNTTTTNAIAKIANIQNLFIQDITIKGTTKKNHGDGKIYAGAVWGIIVKKAVKVRLSRCEVSHFSYRGITVDNSSSNYDTDIVEMFDCVGHNNTSSGFWVSNAKLFRVVGGEFYENGLSTDKSSGYAFTAAAYVKKMVCENVYVHNNYSNGVDAHSCCDLTVRNSVFEDNVYRDISCHAWNTNYDYSPIVTVSNIAIYKGFTEHGKTWLHDVIDTRMSYSASSNSAIEIMCLNDFNSSEVSRGILSDIYLTNVNIYGAYNAMDVNPDVYRTMMMFGGSEATLHIRDCYFDFKNFTSLSSLTSNAKIGTVLTRCKRDRIDNLTYFLPNSVRISNNKIGTFFQYVGNLVRDIIINNSDLYGYDAALMSDSGADSVSIPNNSSIKLKNVNVSYTNGFQKELFESTNYMLTGNYSSGNKNVITENFYAVDTTNNNPVEIMNPMGKVLGETGYRTNTFKKKKYIYVGLGIAANTDLISVIIPKKPGYYGLEIKFKNSPYSYVEDSVVISNESSSNPTGFTIQKSSTRLTVSAITEVTINGVDFYKVMCQNLVTFNGALDVEVSYSSYYNSVGIIDILKEYQ